MQALITRPLEDAQPLADLLRARGVATTIEPLLEIVPRAEAEIDLAGVQALLFTSANGVRAFAAKSSRRDIPVLTVGDGSAAAAREAGFTTVAAAGGDVEALAKLVIDTIDPKAGALFHGAASALAGDLQGRLEAAGFTLRRAVLYDAKTATAFSPETRMNLTLGGVDMVLLFSPRTARTFAELWRGAEQPSLARTTALCLSAAVAREIGEMGWQKVAVAEKPDQPSMLGLVEAEIAARAPEPAAAAATASRPEAAKPEKTIEMQKPNPTRETLSTETSRVQPPYAAAPVPPKRNSGVIGGIVGGAIAALAVGVTQAYWLPVVFSVAGPASNNQDLAALQARIETLETASKSAVTDSDLAKAMRSGKEGAKDAAQQVAQLSDRIGKLEQDLASRSSTASPAPALDLQALQFRLAKLETDLTQVSQQVSNQSASSAAVPPDLSGQIAALKATSDTLSQQLNAARDEIQSLLTKQGELQQQQSEISGTVQKIAAQPPGVTADEQRRAALVVAVGSLRGALSLDRPYSAGLKAVSDLAAPDQALKGQLTPALEPLATLADSGTPTLAQLQQSFPAKPIAEAANAEAAAGAVGAEKGWSERLINRLSEAVTVRPVGENVEGDGPLPRLARGEAKLKAGDLAAAVQELDGLTGKPAAAAAGWLKVAKARLAQDSASAALDQISTALLAPKSE
jgi:uroporphyrinogen-III synthase